MPWSNQNISGEPKPYTKRFDARYDDFPEVRALPPPLLTEWRAHREALEGQSELQARKPTTKQENPKKTHRSVAVLGDGCFLENEGEEEDPDEFQDDPESSDVSTFKTSDDSSSSCPSSVSSM